MSFLFFFFFPCFYGPGKLISFSFFWDVLAATGPAADVVPANSTRAPAELFDIETIQLTDDSLAKLEGDFDEEDLELFDFADGRIQKRSVSRRQAQRCKVFPGDPNWPNNVVWGLFNLMTGGALREPTPLAAPCYDGPWGPYDQGECNRVTGEWMTSKLQYVSLLALWHFERKKKQGQKKKKEKRRHL